jgi:predicted nucleic acid-binding protein
MMLNASLDTSFWNVAAQIGIVPYLFTFFHVYYCQAVEDEIITTDPSETPLIFPQAMLFKIMQEDGRLHHEEPAHPLTQFGTGEANAIALAKEREWILLINDYRPLLLARSLGLCCVSVPDFCLLLYAERRITYRVVEGYLRRLVPTTSPALIQLAEQAAEVIARERGEL